jgi:DNA topoisomerase-1
MELTNHYDELKKPKGKKQQKIEKKKNEKNLETENEDKNKLKRIHPDTLDKCEKLISNLKSKISKLEMKLRRKEEFKQIALGTSKLNYMDPRITVGWCKTNEVPIDKIFTKSIRDKFPWAMYCKPDYNF